MLKAILLILSSEIVALASVLVSTLPIKDEFPMYSDFMIVVYNYENPECTGTLIRPKLVLTYCRLPKKWTKWKLVLGVYGNPYSQKRDVKTFTKHPSNLDMVENIEATHPFHTHDPLPVKVVSLNVVDFWHSWTQTISNFSQCYLIYLKQIQHTGEFVFNCTRAVSYMEHCTYLFNHNQVCLSFPDPYPYEQSLLGAPLFCNKYFFAVLNGLHGKKNRYTFWIIDDKLDLFDYDYMISLGDSVNDLKSEGTRFGIKLLLFLTALNL